MNEKTLSHQFLKLYSQHIFHIPMAAPTLDVMSCHNRNTVYKQPRDIFIFSFPRFTICTSHVYLPRIHSNDTSQTFIYTSMFFVSIITLTKVWECWISYLGFHILHIQYFIDKISQYIPWIFSHLNFPAIYLHSVFIIANSK